jgi:hypothetical protein
MVGPPDCRGDLISADCCRKAGDHPASWITPGENDASLFSNDRARTLRPRSLERHRPAADDN